jgi:pimeloyl-ACP methyl ester carboxylesterase
MPTFQTSDGHSVFYRAQGHGDRGILFLHGNVGTSLWWERVLAHLPLEVRAVAPDNRGCGDSGKPDGAWTMETIAADAYQLMESLGITRYTVVGHSLGGAIAMQLATDHPEVVGRLLLINAAPADGLHFPEPFYAQLELLAQRPDVLTMSLAATMPTAPKDAFYTHLLAESVAKSSGAWVRNTRALDGFNVVQALSALRIPTLIIYGQEKDPVVTQAMAEQTRDQIPGALLELWPGVGHSAPVEAPERLAVRLLQFLDEVR